MILLQSTPFSIVQYITHPIALVAYVCALIVYYFVSKERNDRKKIKENPETYVEVAERIKIDLDKLPEAARPEVVMRVLKNRITGQLILAVSLIIGGLILSYIFVKFIEKPYPPPPNKQTEGSTAIIDPNPNTEITVDVSKPDGALTGYTGYNGDPNYPGMVAHIPTEPPNTKDNVGWYVNVAKSGRYDLKVEYATNTDKVTDVIINQNTNQPALAGVVWKATGGLGSKNAQLRTLGTLDLQRGKAAIQIFVAKGGNTPQIKSLKLILQAEEETCTEQVVRIAYKQMLETAPSDEELQYEAAALDAKSSTVKDLVRKLAHSDTFKQKFLSSGISSGVDQIFYRLLGNHSYLRPDHPAIKLAQEIGWDAYIDGVIDDPQKEYVDKWGNDKVPRDLHGPPRPDLPCK